MRILLAAGLLLAAGPARAKPKAEAPPPAKLELSTAAPASAADVVAHFEAIDRQLTALQARYKQDVRFEDSGMAQTIEGRISYLKPDRLRIEHVKPERQVVVSDGKSIWVHRLSSNQVIHSELAEWRKADPLINSLLDFGGYAALTRRYDVAYATATRVVTLKPKEKGADFTLLLKLTGEQFFPSESELVLARMRVKTTLDEIKFNPPLAEKEFAFTPPPGADVFRNFKPPRLHP